MGLIERSNTSDTEGSSSLIATRLFGGSDPDNTSSIRCNRRLSDVEKDEDEMMMLSPPRVADHDRLPTQRLFGGVDDNDENTKAPLSPTLKRTSNINPYTKISTNADPNSTEIGRRDASSSPTGRSNNDSDEDTEAMSEDETEVVLTSPLTLAPPQTCVKKSSGRTNFLFRGEESPQLHPLTGRKYTAPKSNVRDGRDDRADFGRNAQRNDDFPLVPPPPTSQRRKKPSGYRPTGREDVARCDIFNAPARYSDASELDTDVDDDEDDGLFNPPYLKSLGTARKKGKRSDHGGGHRRSLTADSFLQMICKESIPPSSPNATASSVYGGDIATSSSFDLHDSIQGRTLFDAPAPASPPSRKSGSRHEAFVSQRNDVNNCGFFLDASPPSSPSLNGKSNNSNNEKRSRETIDEEETSCINAANLFRGADGGNMKGRKTSGGDGGYPQKSGRYSFTGSPIEEIEERVIYAAMSTTGRGAVAGNNGGGMGLKARRLNLGPDDATLTLDCHMSSMESITKQQPEDVSPTDVMSFPDPPTRRQFTRNPSVEGRQIITPRADAPPETPLLERRANRRRRPPQHHFGADYDESGEDTDTFDVEDIDSFGMSTTTTTVRKDHRHPLRRHSGERRKRVAESRFSQDFEIVAQIGTGSFGAVHKCLSRLDGCLYAIKVAKRKAKGVADRDNMLKEVYALAALSDQADTAAFHIVRYHQAWLEDDRLHIQTELCSSTLLEVMSKGMLGEKRRYKMLREILLALELIHKNDMVHLDIKPDNIFIKNDQFKLGDFGLVSKITNHDVEEGDSRYMSMELLSGDHKDLTKCDIFSLGATMYEVCLGRFLPSNGQEWQDIRAGNLSLMRETPPELQSIVKEMMQPNADLRPSATSLLKRRQLLSEEQQQLLVEKNKVTEANFELALQREQLKKLTPPRRRKLVRASTWNGF